MIYGLCNDELWPDSPFKIKKHSFEPNSPSRVQIMSAKLNYTSSNTSDILDSVIDSNERPTQCLDSSLAGVSVTKRILELSKKLNDYDSTTLVASKHSSPSRTTVKMATTALQTTKTSNITTSKLCALCNKEVYNMEGIKSVGSLWHRSCYSCGALSDVGCKRVLVHPVSPDYFHFFGCPFCHGCTNKYFMYGRPKTYIVKPTVSNQQNYEISHSLALDNLAFISGKRSYGVGVG